MNTLSLTVPAMHCQHCVHTIKMELGDLVGMKSVDVDLETKRVNVEYESPVTEKEIRGLLDEINYPADA